MNDSFKHSWQVYRRLLAYIQRYWKILILSLISMTIAALTEAAFARLLKPLIDGGFVSKDPDTIRWGAVGHHWRIHAARFDQLYQ